ncbi:MAG: hypothetical protein K0U23_05755 [Gammaproteobacteria bacterium]|nr:hypothetical protein [Gammaproteobacteria bacterium]
MTVASETISDVSISRSVVNAFAKAVKSDQPFPHWDVENVLPSSLIDKILSIRFERPDGFTYDGTRASDSKARTGGTPVKRMFINKDTKSQYPFFQDLVDSFLSKETLQAVQQNFGVDASNLFLRVEYINDFDGFFLDPHMDIVEKKFTLFLYLNDGPDNLGTDFYDANKKLAKTSVFAPNRGYIFLPGENTWHGLERKTIPDRRCSLLINYVTFSTDWPVSSF